MAGLVITPDAGVLTPLHIVLHNDVHLTSVMALVDLDPSAVQYFSKKLFSSLHCACNVSRVDIVQYLIDLNVSLLNQCDTNIVSPLHVACRRGKYKVVKYLLKKRVRAFSEGISHQASYSIALRV
jgi:ankyrin repeat protein